MGDEGGRRHLVEFKWISLKPVCSLKVFGFSPKTCLPPNPQPKNTLSSPQTSPSSLPSVSATCFCLETHRAFPASQRRPRSSEPSLIPLEPIRGSVLPLPAERGAETAESKRPLSTNPRPSASQGFPLFTNHPPNKEVKWEWAGGKYAFSNHPDLGLQRIYYNLLFPCVENGILSREPAGPARLGLEQGALKQPSGPRCAWVLNLLECIKIWHWEGGRSVHSAM